MGNERDVSLCTEYAGLSLGYAGKVSIFERSEMLRHAAMLRPSLASSIYVTFLLFSNVSVASTLHIDLALEHRATTYGWGEQRCGDVGKPRPCTEDATTASGEPFQPHSVPSAAVPAPKHKRLRPSTLKLKLQGVPGAPCVEVRVNDKANPRWIGQRGLDLSPAAVRQLTRQMPTPHWSGKLEQCED